MEQRGSWLGYRLSCWVVAVAATALTSASVRGGDRGEKHGVADLRALQNAFVDLSHEVRPLVVAIRTYELIKPGDTDSFIRVPVSQGTGFIIDPDGYILTNRHVLEDSDQVSVALASGETIFAELIQTDVRSDLAVMKIDATALPRIKWGSLRDVRVGQWAFAVGNPFGLANSDGRVSVTYGVVSALGREMTNRIPGNSQIQYYGNLIETTAAINPGNSGGPLFNIDGEVIGVIAAIETSSGVNEGTGFAIPINRDTRRIIDTLKRGEKVRYGFLGVNVNEVRQVSSRSFSVSTLNRGARIVSLDPRDGPAARAGLQPNDIVIEFNGVPVEDSDHLVRMVGFTPVGREVVLTYVRKKVKRTANVVLGDREELMHLERGGNTGGE